MIESWTKKSVDLLSRLILTEEPHPEVVPYFPQKTELPLGEKPWFPRTAPEAKGVSSRRIADMLLALEKDPAVMLHNLLVVCDGKVICECSHPGYSVNLRHLAHSMSKTVTGLAIGFLYDEGRLSLRETLVSLFPEIPYADARFSHITVEHLLAMATGVAFSEAGTVTEEKWTQAFFASAVTFEPGSNFSYNSMNSYILAKIVERVTGEGLVEFLTPRLFEPLGITDLFWEKGPEKLEKGGWGLYLSAESWAKIGQLLLDRGVFRGKRLLTAEWVDRATATQSIAPKNSGNFNYGYQLWVHRESRDFLFNGMLGQNVWVCPARRLVVVVNAGNNELYQQSPALEILRRFLTGNLAAPKATADDRRELSQILAHFWERRHWIRYRKPAGGWRSAPFDPAWEPMLDTFRFPANNACLLPLFIRVMQNNYADGIDSLTFSRRGEDLFLTVREGEDTYEMQVGLYAPCRTVLDFNGEKYLVLVSGEAIEDEERRPVFKLELLFPEMPNVRKIKFTFPEEGRLLMRLTEIPNERIVTAYMSALPVSLPRLTFLSDTLEKRFGEGYFARKSAEVFSPSVLGVREHEEGALALLAEEERKREEKRRIPRLIASAISRMTEDDDRRFRRGDLETVAALDQILREDVLAVTQDVPLLPESAAERQ